MRRFSLFIALTTAISAAFAQTNPTARAGGSAYPTNLTVPPKASTPIVMKVLPKGTCVLHAKGATTPERSLSLLAGNDGMVQFYVQPDSESSENAAFQIDCQADSQSAQFVLNLRSSSSPTADMPAPTLQSLPPKPGSKVRPALSETDAVNLPLDELLSRGYPPRPDSSMAAGAFRTWLKAVTRPSRLVETRLVPNPGVTHAMQASAAATTTGNWSGYQLQGFTGQYNQVFGTWTVPTIMLVDPSAPSYSSFWIGLDGFGTGDLVQNGTEQDMLQLCFFGTCYGFANDYAWTQFLPQQQYEQQIVGFAVAAGDEIISSVTMCNLVNHVCEPQFNGAYAQFSIENVTRSEHPAPIYTPRGSTFVGGAQAEWILERTEENGSFPDLAAYGAAFMSGAYACGGPCTDYGSPPAGIISNQITMKNGNDVLSVVAPISSTEMEFFWSRWH